MKITARRIKALRIAKGLKQSELAARLKVDTSTVCDWERGRTAPRLGRMQAIAKALGTNIQYLVGGDA